MPSFDLTTYSVGALLLAVSCITLWRRSRSRKLPLPPGPPQLPIIGNLLDMPSKFQWLTFTKWAAQFDTDILYLNVAGTSLVILNTFTAANDLLNQRSRIYSGRPTFSMLTDKKLMGWDRDFVLMNYGDDWNEHRKLFVKHSESLLKSYEQNIKSTHVLLNSLLDTPDQFAKHISYMFGSLIISAAYGIEPLPKDDPYIKISKENLEFLELGIAPGTFIVDFIPWLKYLPEWFPLAAFKKMASEGRRVHKEATNLPFVRTKTDLANGIVRDSFVAHCLQEIQATEDIHDPETVKYQEQLIEETAGTIFEGGTNTTMTAALTSILAMVLHPLQQAKAQEELDRVVGNDRLPEHSDSADLPYVMAVVREVLRWQPGAPLGVPHFISVEDEYKGYRIPKGSTVVGNVWAILHDPEMYPDPMTFNPDRWLLTSADGRYTLNPDVRDPFVGFGFGRRACPGMEMALSSMFITVASVLHSFNITKAVDENGITITPKLEFIPSATNAPAPFKCSIKPRSEKHASLVRKSFVQTHY